jgi:hypothetical protein
MLCLQEELNKVSLVNSKSPVDDNARALSPIPIKIVESEESSPSVEFQNPATVGFFDGLFGCLRPMLTIIGKATASELKGQGTQLVLINNWRHTRHFKIFYEESAEISSLIMLCSHAFSVTNSLLK